MSLHGLSSALADWEKSTAVLYDSMGIRRRASKLHVFGLIRIHSGSLLEDLVYYQTLTAENGEPDHVSSMGDGRRQSLTRGDRGRDA